MALNQKSEGASSPARIPFHGTEIEAVKQGDDVWVSLRRCCEVLGLNSQGQFRKLISKPWARVEEISTRDSAERSQMAVVVHLDSLPMWLATIQLNKVRPEVRDLLAAYQRDAAKVLRDWFFGAGREEIQILRAQIQQLAAMIQPLPEPPAMVSVRTLCEEICVRQPSAEEHRTIIRKTKALLRRFYPKQCRWEEGEYGHVSPTQFQRRDVSLVVRAINQTMYKQIVAYQTEPLFPAFGESGRLQPSRN